MNCHECAMDGVQGPAVAICRFCMVGLCKQHLVESFRGGPVPQYNCRHQAAAPPRATAATAATGGTTNGARSRTPATGVSRT